MSYIDKAIETITIESNRIYLSILRTHSTRFSSTLYVSFSDDFTEDMQSVANELKLPLKIQFTVTVNEKEHQYEEVGEFLRHSMKHSIKQALIISASKNYHFIVSNPILN